MTFDYISKFFIDIVISLAIFGITLDYISLI